MAKNNLTGTTTQKKKILFLITKATWGGAQKYVHDVATHLPREQFNVVVAYGEKGKLSTDLVAANIQIRELPSLGRDVVLLSDVASFFQIVGLLRRERPDVVHLNSSKAAALGALAARLTGVPKIIFTVHGWPFKEARAALTRALIYFVSWFTAALSHRVIVVSKADEAYGKRMRIAGKKISYVPLGIETPRFLARDEAMRLLAEKIPELKEVGSGPRIVSIAELTPNKGLNFGIEAVARLRDRGVNVVYVIIGAGEEHFRLMDLCFEYSVEDRVVFADFLPDAATYLRAFDIYLLPSIKEGMPYVLLEAAAAGLPIVATNVVGTDVTENYKNIRVVARADAATFADAVAQALQGKPESAPARDVFPLLDMLKQTLSLY